MRLLACLFGIVAIACAALAQEKSPSFEVASIRAAAASHPQAMRAAGGKGSPDPSLVTYTRISMRTLLTLAFKINIYQLAAPGWIESEAYEIRAKIPEGATRDQLNVMLYNLLVERFGMEFHREKRDISAYQLTVARGGVRMKESGPSTGDGLEMRGSVLVTSKDANGQPQLPPGRQGAITLGLGPGTVRTSARLQTMADIVRLIEGRLGAPILDKTGLSGTYDFNLDYAPAGASKAAGPAAPPADLPESAPPFEIAIESLGLKLQAVKTPMDVIVIDKLNRVATEN